MVLNPFAVVFWIFAGLIGYLMTDSGKGAAIGVVVAMIISFVIPFLNRD